MSDQQKVIDEANARLMELTQIVETGTAEAAALGLAEREKRIVVANAKQEIRTLREVLNRAQVVKATVDAAQAAQQSKSEADAAKTEATATLERLNAKEKQLDELLAKAAEAVKAKEKTEE